MTYQAMQHHTTEVHKMNLYYSEDPKSQIVLCT